MVALTTAKNKGDPKKRLYSTSANPSSPITNVLNHNLTSRKRATDSPNNHDSVGSLGLWCCSTPPPSDKGPRRAMTSTSQPPTNIYPQYCFHLSPTINRWCPLRAAEIQTLGAHPGFEGPKRVFPLPKRQQAKPNLPTYRRWANPVTFVVIRPRSLLPWKSSNKMDPRRRSGRSHQRIPSMARIHDRRQ